MTLSQQEREKIQTYLQQLFWNPEINLKAGVGADAPAEVYIGKEFVGVVYRNDDDGEISYDWNMSILQDDIDKF